MSAYTDTILAGSPERYWPLDEASGTSATDLVAGEVATAVGMTMGGAAGPTGNGSVTNPVGGLGGVAPSFGGSSSQYIRLRSNKLLGGSSAWTVAAWVYTSLADSANHVWYGEMSPTTGNDQIRCGVQGPSSSPSLTHVYGSDSQTGVLKQSGTVFIAGIWSYLVFTWASGTVQTWWNAGKRLEATGSPNAATWTNAGIEARIGGPPRTGSGSPFLGRVAHLAVYDRVLAKSEIQANYKAATPLQRTLITKTLFKPSAVWNQLLTDVGNPPTIAASSAADVSKLVNQVTAYSAGINNGGGPIYVVDNAVATQRVRIEGGPDNVSLSHPDLYDALGTVPIPTGFETGIATDYEASIYNEDTDEAREFWILKKELMRVEYVSLALNAGGTIPVNATPYAYVVYPAQADGKMGTGRSNAVTVTTGNQTVNVNWGTSEGATFYRIYRRLNTAGSSGGLFMAQVSAATHSWTDDGSVTPGAAFPGATSATADWGCQYAGHLAATDSSTGVYEPPHQNWGASATSLPLYAGAVTLEEAYAYDIPHALTMAVVDTANSHVYPAQRHDYWPGANNLVEGTRFQLNPSYDINLISNPFAKAVAKALQDYGGIIRDHAGAVSGCYIEGSEATGRDPYPDLFDGKQGYEVFTGFPWSQMRVIDPAWTYANTTPPPPTVIPLSTLTDDFDDGVIDPAKWTTAGTVTETAGRLSLQPTGTTYALATSIGGPYSLVGSSLFFKMLGRPLGNVADQSGVQILSDVDLTACKFVFWVDSGATMRVEYWTSGNVRTPIAPQTTWDPIAHAWQRIRESGGTIYFDVSPNGTTWTTFTSFVWMDSGWPASALDAVNVIFLAGNYNGVAGRPPMLVDRLNLAAGVGTPAIDLPTPLTLKPRVTTLSLAPNLTELTIDG